MLASSCSQDEDVPIPVEKIVVASAPEEITNFLMSTVASTDGCSYPFSGTELTNWSYQSRSLARDQNSDKKYYFRASTATNGVGCREIKSRVVNNTAVPIKFRAVGVISNWLGQEDYVLLDGCYTLQNGQSKTIEFGYGEPLYNSSGSNYTKAYDAVMFEIIVPNRNQTSPSIANVSVTTGTCTSDTGTWNCLF
ncbi:MAG: hypothetical protein LBG52_03145 [Candidatus Peribacteria bacterium]|nr:hypothetical protein [Candidatus Peribacteria bacterium]